MSLKAQDIVLLLKLTVCPVEWTFRMLAAELFMSVSEVNEAFRRAELSDLIDMKRRGPKRKNLEEFLIYGLRYVFPAERGTIVRGMPTGYAAQPLIDFFPEPSITDIPVWADPEGEVRGYQIVPLYPSVPKAAKVDANLYELLAIVDALREGRARERRLAQEALHKRLSG